MTKIICIDASTEACSVALLNGEEVTDRYQIAPREHAKLLLPLVEMLLADSDLALNQLDAVACNTGPGAFTGIRIAVSVAQGLAYGANLPAIELSSLNNLAYKGANESNFGTKQWLCAIDARMNEVYFSGYQVDSDCDSQELLIPQVIAPEKIDWPGIAAQFDLSHMGLIGSGWNAYKEIFFSKSSLIGDSKLLDGHFPSAKYGLKQAQSMFKQGRILKPELLQPLYLRNKVAEKKKT